MYWVNGIPKRVISLNNRALHFGDGFFTTAVLKNSRVNFLESHMDRLILSAHRLMFNNINFDLLYQEILQAAAYSINGIIKIIISRINNYKNHVYGYRYDQNIEPLRIIRTSKLSKHYTKRYKSGVRLQISTIRLARNSFFAGIKHLNRLEQVMIASEIHNNKTIDEALVLDTDDNIIECCSANIFWRQNNQVFTPSLYYSGVNGIIRQLIIKLLPSLGYGIQEVMVGIEHLKNTDEVFITNSLLPLASVKMIDNNIYSNKTLFNLLSTYIHNK